MLVAQAQVDGLLLLTSDEVLTKYGAAVQLAREREHDPAAG
jgi:hypothetical protein